MTYVSSIYIYPIKGMHGISVQQAKLTASGFENDRIWMLVNASGKFLSQRSHPILTQFVIAIKDNLLAVRYRNEEISFLSNTLTLSNFDVSVFDDEMLATEVSPETSNWFSRLLGEPVRLVKHSNITNRVKDYSDYVSENDGVPSSTVVSFADGYPYLILGSASMEFLNSKMSLPLPIDRFRANIIVNTKAAHEEDNWKSIQIGDHRILVVKPCARCQVPNIDQKTGLKGREPNQTLSTYRRKENQIFFGMNAVSLTDGILHVGDPVISQYD